MVSLQLGLLQFVEVVWAEFVIGLLRLEHVVDDDEEGVSGSDECFVDPTPPGEATKLRPDIRGLAPRVGPGNLTEDRFEPSIAASRLATQSFPATLLVARADCGAGGEVLGQSRRRGTAACRRPVRRRAWQPLPL